MRGAPNHPSPRRSLLGILLGFAAFEVGTVNAFDLKVGTHMAYSHSTVMLNTGTAFGQIEFAPRTNPRPGFELRSGPFGVSLTAPVAGGDWASPEFSAAEGLTDFRTHYHGGVWGLEAYHRYARGFYESHSPPVYSGPRGEVYRPDMTLRTSGFTAYRALDPDSRVYRLSEGLGASGFEMDFFTTLAASHTRLQDDKPLVEEDVRGFSVFDNLNSVEVASLAAGGGFAITTNLHGIYFDQALFAGYGPQYRAWGDRTNVTWNLVKVNIRAKLGMRSRWFDLGAGFENDAHAAMAGDESALFHSLVARAQLEVFL
jgi:hypothetical protein